MNMFFKHFRQDRHSADPDQTAQSDQGLHYLQHCLHLLDALRYSKTSFFHF